MARELALVLLLVGAVCAHALPLERLVRLSDPDEPSCTSFDSQDACLEASGCAFCSNSVLGDGCVSDSVARLMPSALAQCEMAAPELAAGSGGDKPAPKPKPPTSCGDHKAKRDCLDLGAEEGDCAWCKGDFMPPSCVGVKAAAWIPDTVAQCKMPKKKELQLQASGGEPSAGSGGDKPAPKPKPPTSCGDHKAKRDCLDLGAEEGDCAWCKGDFMPPSCVGVKAAAWIPDTVAQCKMPKKKHGDSDEDALLKGKKGHSKKKHDDDSGSGGGWAPGGGSWPAGGGGWIPGGGDWPSGGGKGPGGQGQGCMSLKSRKKCLKGSGTEACAWCGASSFLGSPCVSETTAKYLPASVAKCELPKGKKSAVAAA